MKRPASSAAVRDNGPGINPQALSRIGERFYRPPGQPQAHDILRRRAAALGLSIVRRIASLHGIAG
ncbi:ATP-binding protein [Klebsiella pneumoniae]|uniref:ATP-binding protein n=1 Tax=Klebsiella pneumoniae TaxID=573 RepID=UPI003986B7E2